MLVTIIVFHIVHKFESWLKYPMLINIVDTSIMNLETYRSFLNIENKKISIPDQQNQTTVIYRMLL